MNTDLTIILVLKDRAPFTWRWMNYYNQIGLPFKVLIADGSEDKSIEKLVDKSLFLNVNYEYIRYPYDKDYVTYFKKVYDALSRIKTKYVVLASNDDFYFIDALNKATDFLDKNEDYITSRGEIYDFQVVSNNKSDQTDDVYGKITNFIKIYGSNSNDEKSALKRVRIFSEYSDGLWHDVCHTEKLQLIYKHLIDSSISDFQLADNLINYLLVTSGKIHREKESNLYMLHQSHIGGLGHELGKIDPFEWILSEPWSKNILEMFHLVANKISDVDKIAVDYAFDKVMQYYISFIIGKTIIKNHLEKKIIQKPPKFVILGRILNKNNKIRRSIRKLYLYIKEYKKENNGIEAIKSSQYSDEMRLINNFLLNR